MKEVVPRLRWRSPLKTAMMTEAELGESLDPKWAGHRRERVSGL